MLKNNFQSFFCSLLFLVFLTVIVPPAYSHPHAFVVTSYTIVFDDQGIQGIRVLWAFDEMYSTTTATEFDLDGDGKLSEDESKELIDLGKESLPDFNYFTNIHIDGKPFPVKSVQDFQINYSDSILTYDFFVECPVIDAGKERKIKIAPYDNEFYLAMLFNQDQPVTFENHEKFQVTTSVGEDKETLIYFDSMHPYALTLQFKKK